MVRVSIADGDDGVTAVFLINLQAFVAVFDLGIGLQAGEYKALNALFLQGGKALGNRAIFHADQVIIGNDQGFLHVQQFASVAELLDAAGSHEVDRGIEIVVVTHDKASIK